MSHCGTLLAFSIDFPHPAGFADLDLLDPDYCASCCCSNSDSDFATEAYFGSGPGSTVYSVAELAKFLFSCNTPFTPFDSKLVNEMLLKFKNVSTKFLCKLFFLNINLTFKTPLLLKPY